MSRIGKLPILVPDGVTVSIEKSVINVKGPKGELTKDIGTAINLLLNDNVINVKPIDNSRHSNAMYGTIRSIIASMIEGVTNNFEKNLEINGVGFRAIINGNILKLNLGYSHDINYVIPEGITITIAESTKLKVLGADKQKVGQVAADIKSYYPVEPYKAKGVRIIGEFVLRKQGKKTG